MDMEAATDFEISPPKKARLEAPILEATPLDPPDTIDDADDLYSTPPALSQNPAKVAQENTTHPLNVSLSTLAPPVFQLPGLAHFDGNVIHQNGGSKIDGFGTSPRLEHLQATNINQGPEFRSEESTEGHNPQVENIAERAASVGPDRVVAESVSGNNVRSDTGGSVPGEIKDGFSRTGNLATNECYDEKPEEQLGGPKGDAPSLYPILEPQYSGDIHIVEVPPKKEAAPVDIPMIAPDHQQAIGLPSYSSASQPILPIASELPSSEKVQRPSDSEQTIKSEAGSSTTIKDVTEASKANVDAEFELDSSPIESSSSDTSTDSSSSEESDEDYVMLAPEEEARRLMQEDGGSDDEGAGKEGKDVGSRQVRTLNEKPDDIVPKPNLVITHEMKIEELGNVESLVENLVLVKARTSGENRVLEVGSVLCLEDRTVIGVIAETLGRVQQPYYSIRFTNAAAILDAGIFKDTKICYVEEHSNYVFTQAIKAIKGSDASNLHDEEVGDDELEFSDDEAEAEHKRRVKTQRQTKRDAKSGALSNGFSRGVRQGGRGHRGGHPNRERSDQPPMRHEDGAGISYDDNADGDELYTPLPRPLNLHEIMGGREAPLEDRENHENASRGARGNRSRGDRGRGRGDRGRPGRGGRGDRRDRGGFGDNGRSVNGHGRGDQQAHRDYDRRPALPAQSNDPHPLPQNNGFHPTSQSNGAHAYPPLQNHHLHFAPSNGNQSHFPSQMDISGASNQPTQHSPMPPQSPNISHSYAQQPPFPQAQNYPTQYPISYQAYPQSQYQAPQFDPTQRFPPYQQQQPTPEHYPPPHQPQLFTHPLPQYPPQPSSSNSLAPHIPPGAFVNPAFFTNTNAFGAPSPQSWHPHSAQASPPPQQQQRPISGGEIDLTQVRTSPPESSDAAFRAAQENINFLRSLARGGGSPS